MVADTRLGVEGPTAVRAGEHRASIRLSQIKTRLNARCELNLYAEIHNGLKLTYVYVCIYVFM